MRIENQIENATITMRGRLLADVLRRHNSSWSDALFYDKACSLLLRHAATHERIQESICSDELTEPQEQARSAREQLLEDRIRAIAESMSLTVEFSGDPRGFTVKLFGVGTHNTWGGAESGYGIGRTWKP